MGQNSSSQTFSDTPASTLKKTPEKIVEVPIEVIPKTPSYAVPQNKVLPTELPSKPLKTVSGGLSKSTSELDNLICDKENKQLVKDNFNSDHNFFSEEKSESSPAKKRGKYQAPSPPVSAEASDSPRIAYSRAALAHRRTNSLDQLPSSRSYGQPHRPVSAINLTSTENTIFEDPEEIGQSNRSSQLPQKSTFPLDYSYAVTYAQLAEHRRKNVHSKLDSEKVILLKQQSLPNLNEEKKTSSSVNMSSPCEVDLDYLTPKRKKYRAPAPPSHVSKHSIILESIPQNNGTVEAPEEPPVDYDTGETSPPKPESMNIPRITNGNTLEEMINGTILKTSSKMMNGNTSNISGQTINGMTLDTPVKSTTVPVIVKSTKLAQKHPDATPLIIHRQQSIETVSLNSPKSPPPVKPKPIKSPDKGKFMFPIKKDTDIVTVNGYVIPESPKIGGGQKEIVSLSIDSKTEKVAAAVLAPIDSPLVSNNIELKTDTNTKHSEIVKTQKIIISDGPSIPVIDDMSTKTIVHQTDNSNLNKSSSSNEKLSMLSSNNVGQLKGADENASGHKVKSVPIGFTTDIFVDTSSVNGNNSPRSTHNGIDSGAIPPQGDQSVDSVNTADRSVDMEAVPTSMVYEKQDTNDEGHVSQSTMTLPLKQVKPLDRSFSSASSDSAKPSSPPTTPDIINPPKMNSILQNDIKTAAQTRVLRTKKPVSIPPPPKDPEEEFKDQLAQIRAEREERIQQIQPPSLNDTTYLNNSQDNRDNDSGIQACSFSEDWTPEHDLDLNDSDDDQRSAVTSRSGNFYEGIRPKSELKASHSLRPYDYKNGNSRLLKKSDSDVSDKYKIGSLRKFTNSVQQAFHSPNKPSKKPNKLDKSSSLPVYTSESQQPGFRRLNPEQVYTPNGVNAQTSVNQSEENRKDKVKTSENGASKKAGVAYVSGKGQIVLLPEFENEKPATANGDDGHRAPKRWKKMKKFSYMATTRKKEKQKKEQFLQDRIAEQERRMEEERLKQLEMEQKFMKVRQVDKRELQKLSEHIQEREINMSSRSTSIDEGSDDNMMENQTSNGNQQNNPNFNQTSAYSTPSLVQTQQFPTVGNPMLLTRTNQPYNPWLHTQPLQNVSYPANMGLGLPNFGSIPTQYPTTSLPYDINNYMQMLDINGQPVRLPVNTGYLGGYPFSTQSLDRNHPNNQIQYPQMYNITSTAPIHQNMLLANNFNNKQYKKQKHHRDRNTIDDSLLNQMYDEHQNGHQQRGKSTKTEKKRSNPLYYSSDEEEEYELRDVHTGQTHSAGTVARISVPDHHINHSQDEEMPSPGSVTSSSADSGPLSYSHQHFTSPDNKNYSSPQQFVRLSRSVEGANLDESYSSADR